MANKFKVGDEVRIVKCSNPAYWYSEKIGKIYTIVALNNTHYLDFPYAVEHNGVCFLQENDIELANPVKDNISLTFNVQMDFEILVNGEKMSKKTSAKILKAILENE